jgi:hypothetical protein
MRHLIQQPDTLPSVLSSMNWKLHQMNVNTSFLNGEIEEEVYIKHPEGFMIYDEKSHVYRLKKVLYGLKQTAHALYEKMNGFLMSLGFSKSVVDPNLYYYIVGDESLILVTYSRSLVVGYKQAWTCDFEMKDMGMMHYFLGQEV